MDRRRMEVVALLIRERFSVVVVDRAANLHGQTETLKILTLLLEFKDPRV